MERAPLRPVPARLPGPVDPDEAIRHVRARLPELEEPAARALALVALAGSTRQEAAAAAGLAPADVGNALGVARKALRRSMFPLPGSGWCERAERLISDRLDDALEPPGPARLEVHLRNCQRCVEHERRLVQATDALLASFVTPRATPKSAPSEAPSPAASLSVVVPEAPVGPAVRPFGEPVRPVPARVRAHRPEPPPAERAPAPPAVARAPEPRTVPGRTTYGLAWSALFALAVVLAVLSVLLAVLGIAGVEL